MISALLFSSLLFSQSFPTHLFTEQRQLPLLVLLQSFYHSLLFVLRCSLQDLRLQRLVLALLRLDRLPELFPDLQLLLLQRGKFISFNLRLTITSHKSQLGFHILSNSFV